MSTDHELDLTTQRSGERLQGPVGRIRLAALERRDLALIEPRLLGQLLLRPASLLACLGEPASQPVAFSEVLQLRDEIGELGRHDAVPLCLSVWDKTNIVNRPSVPLPRLPVLEPGPSQLDLCLLLACARPLALVVAAEEQNDPIAVRVAEDAQQYLGGFARLRPCLLPLPAQHLGGILVQPKLEDPTPETLAEVRADDVRTLVLEELEHRHTDRASLARRQPPEPVEDWLVPFFVLVELERVWRSRHGRSQRTRIPIRQPHLSSATLATCGGPNGPRFTRSHQFPTALSRLASKTSKSPE